MGTNYRNTFFVLTFLIGVLFLHSCSMVVFKEPQPKGCKDLAEFPDSICGKYVGKLIDNSLILSENKTLDSLDKTSSPILEGDSGFTKIENKRFFTTQYHWKKILLSDTEAITIAKKSLRDSINNSHQFLKSSYYEKEDTFYFLSTDIKYGYVGKDFVLRSFNNYYFMNLMDTTQSDSANKDVYVLLMMRFLPSGDFTLSHAHLDQQRNPKKKIKYDENGREIYMTDSAAAKYFSSITPIVPYGNGNPTDYILDPDSMQLRKLIDKGFFSEFFLYKKLK